MSVATSAMFAQETITYDKEIKEDTSLNALQGNTLVETGATLTFTGTNSTNYNLKIKEGAVVDYAYVGGAGDTFKWGTGSGSKSNTIENYGTIYIVNGKTFRFGDASGYSSTLNLYNGSLLTSKEGTFGLENYRGTNTIVNVYTGAEISNLSSITSFARGGENSENPLFQLNIAGGTVTTSGVNLGNVANDFQYTQKSEINVTNGGKFTSTGTVNLGQNAYNNAQINVSGENSKWTSNGIVWVGANKDATASVSVKDGGVIETNNNLNLQYGDLTINDKGTVDAKSGVSVQSGGITVNSGGIFNTNAGVEVQNGEILVNAGGQYNIVTAANLTIGNVANQKGSIKINGGSLNMNSLWADNPNISIYLGTTANAEASLILTNGATYQQIDKGSNSQVYMNNGTGKLEVSNGAMWKANTNFYVGNGNGANSTLTLNNGSITNADGKSNTSDFYIANASGATGLVEISNGGYANLRTLKMAQGGANATAKLVLKDAGSLIKINMANDIGQSPGYQMFIGMNVDEVDNQNNSKYTGNSAIIEIHTGAQFLNAASGYAYIKDSAQVQFVINSANIDSADVAMFSTKKLSVYKNDHETITVSNPFVIDGKELSSVANLKEGDVADFLIMTVTDNATLNDDILSFGDYDTLASIFEFKNNTNLEFWQDFGVDNLSWDGSNLTLSLTYVPEPSTYAAIFGALALAFVAYRRKK